jgi:hypothetical protein
VFAYPSDGRIPGYGYSVLVPTDSRTPFDECWVEGWPVSDQLIGLLSTTLRPGALASSDSPTQGPQLLQLNSSLGAHFDGAALYRDRITRFAPEITALAAATLAFVAVIRRRLELAAARHSGVTATAQALQMGIESLIWASAAALLTASALVVVAIIAGDGTPLPFWPSIARVIAVTVPGAFLGTLGAALTIRERHLFSYFRSR